LSHYAKPRRSTPEASDLNNSSETCGVQSCSRVRSSRCAACRLSSCQRRRPSSSTHFPVPP